MILNKLLVAKQNPSSSVEDRKSGRHSKEYVRKRLAKPWLKHPVKEKEIEMLEKILKPKGGYGYQYAYRQIFGTEKMNSNKTKKYFSRLAMRYIYQLLIQPQGLKR